MEKGTISPSASLKHNHTGEKKAEMNVLGNMCSCICGIILCPIVYHQPARERERRNTCDQREESAAALCSLHLLLPSTS